jgi:RNA polymerase sigma factor (sigma-70 family)
LPIDVGNPFSETPTEPADEALLAEARAGGQEALERLLLRHQQWVLNIAVRMLWQQEDAEDATQEILIKVLRALPTFRGESTFRTWLHRIAVNHILDLRRRGWLVSAPRRSFAERDRILSSLPDLDLPDPRTVPVPLEILVEEAKIGCTTGVLLCLDGRQRLVFILGEILGANDKAGAEIVGVTPANFRQILSRARRDLYQYLQGSCSLVNPEAPCKCARKTRAFMERGFLDPQRLLFTRDHRRRVREVVEARAQELWRAFEAYGANVFRDHPFYECSDPVAMLREALAAFSPDLWTDQAATPGSR